MKKATMFVLAAASTISMTGCGSSQKETEAPKTEAATEAKTEAKTEAATEKETEAKTEAVTEKATETETEKVTEAESEVETETEKATEAESETETEKVTEAESETETEKATEAESESETEIETETETESEVETEKEKATEAESESETEVETETETESEVETEKEKATEAESESETEVETETEPESGVETETEKATKAESESETEVETETETEKVTEKGIEKATEAETEAATEAKTEKATEAETETEKVTEAATEAGTEEETEEATEKATEPVEVQTESEAFEAPEGTHYKAALLLNGNLGDKSFYDSANEGLERLRDELGEDVFDFKVEQMGGTAADEAKWEPTLLDYCDTGDYDVIIMGTWQMADALARVDGIMDRRPLEESGREEQPKDHSIIFERVSFRYEDAAKDALHQINLKIGEGEHVAFIGPSGGGKTTLASLIARFFDVTEGAVKIGGVDVRDIPSKELLEQVSFVFQDSKLLKMSIYDNVRMGKKDASREEVMEALKNAQCEDIIEKLPDGMDTIIGTKGTYVSGGEAQRLSIARAMLKNAPILILDEATAFADPDNETKVQEAFSRLSKGKTVVMIAHRLSSVTNADRIFVLKDGEIEESGTHESLEKANGLYAHMWEKYNQSVCWKVGV